MSAANETTLVVAYRLQTGSVNEFYCPPVSQGGPINQVLIHAPCTLKSLATFNRSKSSPAVSAYVTFGAFGGNMASVGGAN